MDFIAPELEKYASEHSTEESDLLKELTRETYLKVLMPRMLSGHIQGRFLSMIAHLVAPKRILEIGTYTGYSALCMAEGLAEDGLLITLDINPEFEQYARKYFDRSPFKDKIISKVGNAMEIIPSLEETFDLVFIDADKINYLEYYQMVLPKVRTGGLILADNVLWSGKVTEPAAPNDKDTAGLKRFNEFVARDERVEKILLPLRDGIFAIRKK